MRFTPHKQCPEAATNSEADHNAETLVAQESSTIEALGEGKAPSFGAQTGLEADSLQQEIQLWEETAQQGMNRLEQTLQQGINKLEQTLQQGMEQWRQQMQQMQQSSMQFIQQSTVWRGRVLARTIQTSNPTPEGRQ